MRADVQHRQLAQGEGKALQQCRRGENDRHWMVLEVTVSTLHVW